MLELKYTDKDLDDVVERCARVAENQKANGRSSISRHEIAAAIRKLKDANGPTTDGRQI